MAYELWMSKQTGYRRRGTTVAELRDLFERHITTEAIFEPLKSCFWNDDAALVAKEMHRLGFDIIGVKQSSDTSALHKLTRPDSPQGTCGQLAIPIAPDELVASSTPLIDLLDVLKNRNYVFVLVGFAIDGIVTRADLQKPPVRILLFGLISLLEMHLSFWINESFPSNTWKSVLSPGRLEKAQELLELRRKHNEEITLLDCLQFCDKRTFVLANNNLSAVFGWPSKAAAQSLLETAERVRDKLAHSQFDLEMGDTWNQIIEVIQGIEKSLLSSEASIERKVRGAA